MDTRLITKKTIPDCARLLVLTYNEAPWRYKWDQTKAERYLTEYTEAQHFIGFAIYEDNEITCALFAHTRTWWVSDQLYIDELFVYPGKQRSSYGKMLMEQAMTWAQNNGFPTICLMTNKFMPAFEFYNKNGFAPAEQFVYLYKQTK
jgi:aminoglycoside 6'-N-acetyltransferase I